MSTAEKALHARMAKLTVSQDKSLEEVTALLSIGESGAWRIIIGETPSLTPVLMGIVESDCEIEISDEAFQSLEAKTATPQQVYLERSMIFRGNYDSARYFSKLFWREFYE